MVHEISPETEGIMDWRDFRGLMPTDVIAEWETPNDRGYSEHWVTRIVFEDRDGIYKDNPIIEFYDINSFGQFVSSYFVETLLDSYENGYYNGGGLALQGDVHSWSIDTENMKEICAWMYDECYEYGWI
jgi:hypothetical protein